MSRWTTYLPPLALVVLVVGWLTHPEGLVGVVVVAVFLVAAVLAAVHHAEVVAHRVGDPLGSPWETIETSARSRSHSR